MLEPEARRDHSDPCLLPGLLSRSYKAAQSPKSAWLSVDRELTGGSNPSPSNHASETDRPLPSGTHAWGPCGEGQRKCMSSRALGWKNEQAGSGPVRPCILMPSAGLSFSFSLWPPHFPNGEEQSREDKQASVWMLPVGMLDKFLKILKLQSPPGRKG